MQRTPKRSRSRVVRPRQRQTRPAGTSTSLWRYAALGVVALVVSAAGLVLGFGDFLGQREGSSSPGVLTVRMSMAGFDPPIIRGSAGEKLQLELWTTDSAAHLERGVHTLISDELGIYEELPANSRRIVTISLPATPGDYDIYCDTCCGGRLSPSMHGLLRVEA